MNIHHLGYVARLFAIETQFIRAVPLYMARISTQETYADFLQIGKNQIIINIVIGGS